MIALSGLCNSAIQESIYHMPFGNWSMPVEHCNGVPQSVLCLGSVISGYEVRMAEQITGEVVSTRWNVAAAARLSVVQTERLALK